MKLKSPTPPFKTHSLFFGINSYGYHYAKCSKCGIIGKKSFNGVIYKYNYHKQDPITETCDEYIIKNIVE